MKDKATLKIEREVLNELKKLGKKGETYSDIIKRLMECQK